MHLYQIYWVKYKGGVLFLSRSHECENWEYRFYQYVNVNKDFQSVINKYKMFNNQGRRIQHPMSVRIYDIEVLIYKELIRELETMVKVSE